MSLPGRAGLAGLLAVLTLLAGGCGASQPANTAEFNEDVALIEGLWRGFSESWSDGAEAGYAFVADHNHPVLECEADDFEPFRLRLPDPFRWEVVVNDSSIERDDGWEIHRGGVSEGPAGRIYVHQNTVTYTGNFPEETRFTESHSAILDGQAVFFFPCRE